MVPHPAPALSQRCRDRTTLFPLPPAPPTSSSTDAASRGGQELSQRVSGIYPKAKGRFTSCLARLLFLFSQVRVVLLKFPAMDMLILGANILLRNMAKSSDCISHYLGHSPQPQELSAAWCAGPVKYR